MIRMMRMMMRRRRRRMKRTLIVGRVLVLDEPPALVPR